MRPYDSAEDRDVTAAARGTYVVRPGETTRADERDVSYQIDGSDTQGHDEPEPEQIRVEIEETRLEMTATVDAIQERLNPSVLMEQAKEHAQDVVREATDHAKDAVLEATDHAKEAVREATVGRAEEMMHNATDTASGVKSTIMDTIRANPLPAAIAGISLGWLFLKRSHRSSQRGPVAAYSGDHYWQGNANGDMHRTSPGGVGHVAGQVQDRAGEMAGQVQDRVGDMAGRVQDRASGMAEQVADTAGHVAEGAQRMQGRIGEILEDSPLIAGALALTVGAAIGLATPGTEQERELFGETRDNLMRQARGTAHEMGQKVQRVAEQAQDAAVKAVEEEKVTA